ncbi:hypothetical protein JW851_01370 [Candidatus Woesearchaeota archaeon]|nr:hypothetical protein [Candidatus Woesearchaeota archaeon]
MKKRLVILVLLILLSIQVFGYCIDPKDGKTILTTSNFCAKKYQLQNGIEIGQNEITIDCGSAVIQGLFQGKTGILIENKNNVIIKNCMIMNYDVGIEFINSTNITISNIALIRNQIGIKIVKSNNNTFIENRDISLKRPIQEIESFENIFQYENKNINADFCRYNTCNEKIKIQRLPEKTAIVRTDENKLKRYSLQEILMKSIQIWINTH